MIQAFMSFFLKKVDNNRLSNSFRKENKAVDNSRHYL